MKKFICLALAFVMCAAVLTGCGKFDIENEDLTAYVKLGDITDFPYEELCERYEAYREQLSETTKSFYPTTGYTLDFFVTAELVGEDGTTTEIEAWTHDDDADYIKDYDVYRYADKSAFDYGVCYKVDDVSTSTTAGRTVKVDEAFSFTMKLDKDYEDDALAGKTVKFTVTVKKALPAVYTDSYISDLLVSFYNAVAKSKDVIEYGDTIKMNFTGTIDGEKFDGGTGENYSIVVGEAGFIEGFESQLVGHKNGEKFEITVTFPEDYEPDETLAGKEAVFAIEIKDVYNDNALITENTPFDNIWELKYAFRVQSFSEYALMDFVYDRSELISYPDKLVSTFEKIYTDYVNRKVSDMVATYAQYGQTYTKKEVREMLYPDGSDKTYIEESAKKAAYQYIVVKLTQKALGIEYTDEDYAADLEQIAKDYTSYYGVEYTAKEIESLYGEEVMRLSFIETLVTDTLLDRISGAPEIPQSGTSES